MKKKLALMLACALALTLGLTACGDDEATETSTEPQAQEEELDLSNLKVGQTVDVDGLKITVKSVKSGLVDYDGEKVTRVTVKYKNTRDDKASFNIFDWKAEDKNGVQKSEAFYTKAKNTLDSGELSPGGHVTGNLYFEGKVAKVIYEPLSLFGSDEIIWNVKKK